MGRRGAVRVRRGVGEGVRPGAGPGVEAAVGVCRRERESARVDPTDGLGGAGAPRERTPATDPYGRGNARLRSARRSNAPAPVTSLGGTGPRAPATTTANHRPARTQNASREREWTPRRRFESTRGAPRTRRTRRRTARWTRRWRSGVGSAKPARGRNRPRPAAAADRHADRHAGVARRRRRGRSRHRGHHRGGLREGCGDEGQRRGGREGVAASRDRFVRPDFSGARLFVGRFVGAGKRRRVRGLRGSDRDVERVTPVPRERTWRRRRNGRRRRRHRAVTKAQVANHRRSRSRSGRRSKPPPSRLGRRARRVFAGATTPPPSTRTPARSRRRRTTRRPSPTGPPRTSGAGTSPPPRLTRRRRSRLTRIGATRSEKARADARPRRRTAARSRTSRRQHARVPTDERVTALLADARRSVAHADGATAAEMDRHDAERAAAACGEGRGVGGEAGGGFDGVVSSRARENPRASREGVRDGEGERRRGGGKTVSTSSRRNTTQYKYETTRASTMRDGTRARRSSTSRVGDVPSTVLGDSSRCAAKTTSRRFCVTLAVTSVPSSATTRRPRAHPPRWSPPSATPKPGRCRPRSAISELPSIRRLEARKTGGESMRRPVVAESGGSQVPGEGLHGLGRAPPQRLLVDVREEVRIIMVRPAPVLPVRGSRGVHREVPVPLLVLRPLHRRRHRASGRGVYRCRVQFDRDSEVLVARRR